MNALATDLNLLVQAIQCVPSEKNYWLIRTQSGSLYQTFIDNNYISIGHKEIPLQFLNTQKVTYRTNESLVINEIKQKIQAYHASDEEPLDGRNISLIASQIVRFAYDIKVGDIIIIPSFNSNNVSFGIIKQEQWINSDYNNNNDNALLKRPVTWLKEVQRRELDPYLYRMFTAHQAVNKVNDYAEIVERSINDLFILDDEAHFIINVGSDSIAAKDLFGLGSNLMDLLDEISQKFSLGVSSKDLQVTININSPGKIDIKSKIKSTTIVLGIILLFCGGGYETQDGTKLSTDGLPGVIKAIDEYLNHRQERELKENIFTSYKDSLQIKEPEDIIQLLKQVSENKDIAK
ncbi:hypothetical protein [Parabacteroides johnsonii]|uniref:hypothetical protein n=1 Tax=Parabacteroides johnsonii TaxID=387661 RepID=UPI00248EA961|nr:hypothetical protein [Parabacteroides johnsonii]